MDASIESLGEEVVTMAPEDELKQRVFYASVRETIVRHFSLV
jgi:hypothetical protein